MESDAAAPVTSDAFVANLEARLNAKFETLIGTAMERIIAKVMEALPTMIAQHVANLPARLAGRSS